MGRRGPPPKPSRLKELAGNPGRRPLNPREPKPAAGRPRQPVWLPAGAKKAWREVCRTLEAIGLLTTADGHALTCLCLAWHELETATATLEAEGRHVRLATGYLTPHPAVAQQRSAWNAVRQFSQLFGLDPSSRSRVALPATAEGPADPLEELILRAHDAG